VGTERVPRGFFATVVTGAEEETERDEMVSSGGGIRWDWDWTGGGGGSNCACSLLSGFRSLRLLGAGLADLFRSGLWEFFWGVEHLI
jgi:hypothetical protein